ncbi:hypothetical protein GOEFS_071_00190 [Gordonia effusa NBRC 100432]|uniref:Uncharacterized protein n=1 Tax=Gordonia effusa NBRC 100432 TaxID=1077974 RepID=H0R1M4_9ACTN|nr:Tox-REase-5 domain-containing protein [Gordonia effusa]GAB18975.1 hypothetical protein GOEFS_071_00190 [Gordonia effusa NBRC 100432]
MTNFPPGPVPAGPAPFTPVSATKKSKLPLITLVIGALLLVVALVFSFYPFARSADGGPTSAFRAQQELDKVVFGFAQSTGAKYTGSITYSFVNSPNTPERTINFKNLVVASNNNAEGGLSIDGVEAQYRQLGNDVYANGSKTFWTKLMPSVPETLDLDSAASKWVAADSTGLLWLGFLAPRRFAGRLAIGDTSKNIALGQELESPNKGLPDARFWPTSDPTIKKTDNSITAGTMTTTFDPETKAITHIKGSGVSQGTTKYKIDASVAPVTENDLSKLFANERSFAPELTAVPALGLRPQTPMFKKVDGGQCTPARCEFIYDVQGKLTTTRSLTGYFNYGVTGTFTANNAPVGGTCNKVVRVNFNTTGRVQCDAVNLGNLPNGTSIRPKFESKYLPFITSSAADISRIIDNNEKSVKKELKFARTGSKRSGGPTTYNSQVTDMPSAYVVEQGGYQFDGFGPSGSFLVSFSPGYDQHVNGGVFDPSWAGTTKLREQAAQQVKAAAGTEVVWVMAEQNAAVAARALLASAGITSSQIVVINIAAD